MNSSTKTVVFESVEGEKKVQNWKKHYSDIEFIGKHFRVRNIALTDKDCVWRHYTICNSMQPDYYQSLIKALMDEGDSRYTPFTIRLNPID